MSARRPFARVGLALVLLVFVGATPFLLARDPGSSLSPSVFEGRAVTYSPGEPLGSPLAVHGRPAMLAIADLAGLDPSRDSLLILEPSHAFSGDDVREVHLFLQRGGRVLLAAEGSVGIDLLRRLDVGIQIENTSVYTPSFRDDPRNVLARSTQALVGLPDEVLLTQPSLVSGGTPILLVPELSWLDRNSNLRPDLDETLVDGAFAAWKPVGDGLLVVLGDPDAIAGASSPAADAFLDHLTLFGARRLVVDESHRSSSDPLAVNALLAGDLPLSLSIGILMTAGVVAGYAVLGPRFKGQPRRRPARGVARGADPKILDQALTELQPR